MGIGDKLWTSADIKGLCEKNDVFGTIPKGDAIINILSNHREDLLKNDLRMIALYGNWGSGKTSLLNYINDRITQDNETKVIFFKAWEMESDDNLALSLLEQMIDVFYSEVKSEKLREKLKMIGNTVLRLAKNIVLNTSVSIPLTGISFDVANAGKDTIDEMKKIASKKSQYHQINKFKDEFNDLVNKIIEETTYKKIFIFVDDLDRCEPENVINLISNIKLFFSLSNELMYLCAIDKNAVSNALRIKYGNVIKSEEYLEKIFDIEFNMPTNMKLEKVVEKHFFLKANEMNLLVRFFNDIRFNNPRKILRLMNKYELIKLLYGENDKVFNENDFLYIIFLLYFLIIKEGFNVVFADFLNLEKRLNNIKIVNDLVNTQSITSQTRVSKHWLKITKEKEIRIIEYLNKILSCEKFEIEQDFLNNKDSLHEFMIRFTPYYDNAIEMVGIVNDKNSYKRYINQFENEENYILTSFVNFIIDISQLSNTPKQIEQKAEFDLYSIIDLVLSIT